MISFNFLFLLLGSFYHNRSLCRNLIGQFAVVDKTTHVLFDVDIVVIKIDVGLAWSVYLSTAILAITVVTVDFLPTYL